MAEHPQSSITPQASSSTAHPNLSPSPPRLRQRTLRRAATLADPTPNRPRLRRSSTLSDTVFDAKRSIQSSTDDLLLPRADKGTSLDDESYWHSAPLALALLPAIAGIFFKNGSAIITDLILLILAAIFLNWSVRLPWDWYRSAQQVRQQQQDSENFRESLLVDDDTAEDDASPKLGEEGYSPRGPGRPPGESPAMSSATKELQIHELAALVSCFLFPLIGTWILHAIRSRLSRPSEGLVSNYNLTIFLLASEIRPLAHLLKLVQGRTLYLQRVVASPTFSDNRIDKTKFLDLVQRLEALEAHVADGATATAGLPSNSLGGSPSSSDEQVSTTANVVAQATLEVRKALHPEIDALNRAMRRYEKRTTVMVVQIDSKFQELETQIHDAMTLATPNRRRCFGVILIAWVRTVVMLPVQALVTVTGLPVRLGSYCLQNLRAFFMARRELVKRNSKGKQPQSPHSISQIRSRQGYVPSSPSSQQSTRTKKAM